MIKQIAVGVATYVPGARRFFTRGTGGTDSARYCYSVWLRHLAMAKAHGLNTAPQVVAELGPGDSLGIGLAALISGCEHYNAFDVMEYANTDRNLKVFDELVSLFRSHASIPSEEEFPNLKPLIDRYDFPADVLDDRRLQRALNEARLQRIRESILCPHADGAMIQYRAPWQDGSILRSESVDMIYSQAVLEHVEDLQHAYRTMRLWLKPGGYMSHQIDLKSHGLSDAWNGHWQYSDLTWRLMRGNRPWLINREPHSRHLAIMQQEGFRVVWNHAFKLDSSLRPPDLAKRFKGMSNDDLTTSGVFVQAVKTA